MHLRIYLELLLLVDLMLDASACLLLELALDADLLELEDSLAV